ncbi:MAG: hypothetical protein KDD53_06765, partial [Bdellovibrionales bacterium]|nr:hypothetical protein [Bdellovibrionales bacterium]
KSLLRHNDAASAPEQLTFGAFHTVLEDLNTESHKVNSVFFASGKICHEINATLREEANHFGTVIRIEQLYPLPVHEIQEAVSRFPNAKNFYWVQEEPQNMGAWSYMDTHFRHELGIQLSYVGRIEGASTAGGSAKRHAIEQQRILTKVLDIAQSESGL